MNLKLDTIVFWLEVKLDILREYAQVYSRILTKKGLYHVYVDAFAGPEKYISERTGRLIAGSPQIPIFELIL